MSDPQMWRRAAPVLSLILSMTYSIIGGALVGLWADQRWGTRPWITVVLILGGFGLGLRNLLFFLKRVQPPDAPNDPPPP